MKAFRLVVLSLTIGVTLTAAAFGLRAMLGRNVETVSQVEPGTVSAAEARQTPADARIRAAENQIKARPDAPEGYNLLAAAYMQKARETADFDFNAKAGEALDRSNAVAPNDYDALKLRARLLLTEHRFRDALSLAERAQKIRPNDHDAYGALTDAHTELGNYEEAVEAAQRMVDLRPDASAYARVAYLRSLHGDTEGAIEAMRVAVQAADPRDPEAVAWYRTHLGDELMNAGKLEEAERQYDAALAIFPGYELALTSKARARIAAGDLDGAVKIYEASASHDALLALGEIYAKQGRTEDASRAYAAFEEAERVAAAEENDMGHMARFWADRGVNLNEAVEIMRSEREERADIYTSDALAWALFKSGQSAEAKKYIEEALRLGTRDARMNYHAGMIYASLGDSARAAKRLKLALEINPAFSPIEAENARITLREVSESSRRVPAGKRAKGV